MNQKIVCEIHIETDKLSLEGEEYINKIIKLYDTLANKYIVNISFNLILLKKKILIENVNDSIKLRNVLINSKHFLHKPAYIELL